MEMCPPSFGDVWEIDKNYDGSCFDFEIWLILFERWVRVWRCVTVVINCVEWYRRWQCTHLEFRTAHRTWFDGHQCIPIRYVCDCAVGDSPISLKLASSRAHSTSIHKAGWQSASECNARAHANKTTKRNACIRTNSFVCEVHFCMTRIIIIIFSFSWFNSFPRYHFFPRIRSIYTKRCRTGLEQQIVMIKWTREYSLVVSCTNWKIEGGKKSSVYWVTG